MAGELLFLFRNFSVYLRVVQSDVLSFVAEFSISSTHNPPFSFFVKAAFSDLAHLLSRRRVRTVLQGSNMYPVCLADHFLHVLLKVPVGDCEYLAEDQGHLSKI